MKTFNLFVAALLITGHAFAADALTEKLQRGLFEEEANHNLDAAIKEYQSVVAQSDEQRKVIATALFRLGESYRKLGRTNEANAQYQRILRDFSEQEALVKLSRELTRGSVSSEISTGGGGGIGEPELVRELERRQARLQGELSEARSRFDVMSKMSREELLRTSLTSDSVLADLQQQLGKAKQMLDAPNLPKETIASRTTTLKRLDQEIEERLESLLATRRIEVDVLNAQTDRMSVELANARSKASSLPAAPPGSPTLTQAEAEELARVKTLAKNSPDLLQSSGGVSRDSELQSAASKGHYSVVEFILAQGVNANGPERGSPPLLLAAQRGHLRIVQLLLDRGADVNAANASGQTALMSACENGFRSVVELLLARGADVNRVTTGDATALHFAVQKGHAGLAELLLQRGANPNVLSRYPSPNYTWSSASVNGATPLHLAVDGGFMALVELLLKVGASATATNYALKTPLDLAAAAGGTNLCALLLDRGANPNAQAQDDYTPLVRAIETGRPEVVALLLAKRADVNRANTNRNGYSYYPIHIAVGKNLEVLDALLAAKPNLEVINGEGQTPLTYALNSAEVSSEKVDRLLAAGADPNRETTGVVPVLSATRKGNLRTVTALLKHGANPNVIDKSGETPLSFAQNVLKKAPRDYADWEQIERTLREHGANENLRRLTAITFTRPTWTAEDRKVFYRGTNDYNGYTLFELLAGVFSERNAPAFPDLAHVTLERIEGTNAKSRELFLNIEEMVRSGQCSSDVRLEWGDRISFPELDHPLNENWPGLSQEMRELLMRCLTRRVQVIVKQETNVVKLVQDMASGSPRFFGTYPPPMIPGQPGGVLPGQLGGVPTLPAGPAAPPKEKPEKVLFTFRLKEVVYGANVLRASSDPTRVRVLRREPNQTNEWVIDLTKVATNGEWNSPGSNQQTKLWPQHDLWLRDGDVIEIPDKL